MASVLSSIPGMDFVRNLNWSAIFQGAGYFILFLIIIGLVGGALLFFFYKLKEKGLYKNKLHFFEEITGIMQPTEDLNAMELIVPGTSIRVFYIKERDLYMPRGTKKMGKDAYWYAILNNREIVNFTMKNLNKELTEAGLDYDHTDVRYAYENLREIIKRNYKDKSAKWWKEYKDVIATVIFIFVLTLSFIFIISRLSGVVDKIGVLLETANTLIEKTATLMQSTGGIPSGIASA